MRRLMDGVRRLAGFNVTFVPDAITLYLQYLGAKRFSPRTVRNYRNDLELVERKISKPLVVATKQDLDVLMCALNAQGLKSSTIRRKQATLRGFYKWALKAGHIQADPTEGFEPPKSPDRLPVHLNAEQVTALLGVLDESTLHGLREAALVKTLYYTGARASEAAGLVWERVNLDTRQLRVIGKGDKERSIPIPEALADVFALWRAYHPTGAGPVFCALTAPHRAYTYDRVYRTVRQVLARAGLQGQGFSTHKLRHTAATRLWRGGVPLEQIQRYLGHKQISTTLIYAHVEIGDDFTEAVNRIL